LPLILSVNICEHPSRLTPLVHAYMHWIANFISIKRMLGAHPKREIEKRKKERRERRVCRRVAL